MNETQQKNRRRANRNRAIWAHQVEDRMVRGGETENRGGGETERGRDGEGEVMVLPTAPEPVVIGYRVYVFGQPIRVTEDGWCVSSLKAPTLWATEDGAAREASRLGLGKFGFKIVARTKN